MGYWRRRRKAIGGDSESIAIRRIFRCGVEQTVNSDGRTESCFPVRRLKKRVAWERLGVQRTALSDYGGAGLLGNPATNCT